MIFRLAEGKSYYIEALQKQKHNLEHIEVAVSTKMHTSNSTSFGTSVWASIVSVTVTIENLMFYFHQQWIMPDHSELQIVPAKYLSAFVGRSSPGVDDRKCGEQMVKITYYPQIIQIQREGFQHEKNVS